MSRLLKLTEIKVESVDPDVPGLQTLTPSNVQITDAEVFGNKFNALKSEVCQTLMAYKQNVEREAQQRFGVEVQLGKEVDHRLSLERKIKELTDQNETLSKEMKELLRQNRHTIKSLQDELNVKQEQVNDLNKQCQKLLIEKASFNKNFKTRLTCFLNDMSFSDAVDDNLETPSDVPVTIPENSGQPDKKRSSGFDTSFTQNESNQMSKRFKTDDCSLPHPHLNACSTSTVVFEKQTKWIGEAQPILTGSYTPRPEPVEENATANRSSPSIDNEPDWRGDANHYLTVVLNENPIQDRPCRSADDNSDLLVVHYKNPISSKPRSVRRNIKKIMDYEKLTPETKHAYLQEKERKTQYARRLQKYSETYGTLPGELNDLDQILLDFDLNTKAELLAVDRRLSTKLKPHQCEGVKFMWDACFESIEKLQRSKGSGCILSHCMGLGKTLQVITLVHTLLTHRVKTKVSKVMIICPVNVILNWVDEFEIWLRPFPKHESINVFELVSNRNERVDQLRNWHLNGGVLIIGYTMFQMMYKNMERQFGSKILYNALIDPGADLVVCDEGHLLKNPSSQLSVNVNKIRTLRRIVLTGTPLQNNLKEYFAMVEFIKPRLLGTEREFNNRFVGPIVNGQFVNSTEKDTTLMKHRAYTLHKLLEGCVHRRDYSVLAKFLPPKEEHVLFIRLTKNQMDLYKYYMANFVSSQPITDLPPLRRICNHPMVLADFQDRHKRETSTSQKNDDGSEPGEKLPQKNDNGSEPGEKLPHKLTDWWKPICSGDQLEMSNKMVILLTILNQCELRNEKLVVFSGCLSTLNVIEHFLNKISATTQYTTQKSKASSADYRGIWERDLDYSRLDGRQSAEKRRRDVTRFNKESNTRTRLFLVSTKAGSLGINLIAANRVIIFDASWNPSDDIQSIFRVYRIGQQKKCYIYRFVSLGTMEEKIYDRQVSKLSIAKRVIDEHQICRHYREEDLQQLYSIENLDPPAEYAYTLTGDILLNSIFQKYGDIVYKHHDHDSLLENVAEETVTEEDVGDFWEMFN